MGVRMGEGKYGEVGKRVRIAGEQCSLALRLGHRG